MELLFTILFLITINETEEIYQIDPIMVSAPYPFISYSDSVERYIIEESGGFFETLQIFPSVELFIRNPFGIQSDLSIRGSTFQQTLVLFDGIPINDPQTAHHNQDIPFSLLMIENIYLLNGFSSNIWGPDAFGGGVLLRTLSFFKGAKVRISKGNYGYSGNEAVFGRNIGGVNFIIAGENFYSNGFTEDRDFLKNTFSLKIEKLFKRGYLNFLLGYGNKRFGAQNFYAPYPSWEKTSSLLSGITLLYEFSKIINSIILWSKFHSDSFILIKNNPSFYSNKHQKSSYGLRDVLKFSRFSVGLEFVFDKIKSSRLGNHGRKRFSLFFGIKKKTCKFVNLDFGLRYDNYNFKTGRILPFFNLNLSFFKDFSLDLSYRASYRLPSFTELYYYSPSNHGDSLLIPEYSKEIELTLRKTLKSLFFQFRSFYRKDLNLISWVKEHKDSLWFWKARNIKVREIVGFEPSLTFRIYSINIKFGYKKQFYNSSPENLKTKYALRISDYKFVFTFVGYYKLMSFLLWGFYKKIYNEKGNYLFHSSFYFTPFKKPRISFGIKIFNLFNNYYEDFEKVPYPSRTYNLVIKLKF